MNTFSTIIADV